jgi:hypothetical protein
MLRTLWGVIMRRFQVALLATVAVIGFALIASAADMPVKAPVYKAPAAVVTESGYYFWLDGMYDRVPLPTYQLGLHNTTLATSFTDMGPVNTFDPRLNGGGVRGAIGYVMPGTSTKFELGGSYVAANSSQSQSTSSPNNYVAALLINGGGLTNAFNCSSGAPGCTTAGSLSTSYSAWQFNGKVSNDWKYGSVTLTPSLAVFGGNTRVGQTLSQSFLDPFFAITGAYSASTTENWWDIGARVGVDVNAPVTTALTVGIGGWVGGANRHTSLSGNDTASDNGGVFCCNSTLSIGDNKSVLLANAEAGFAYKLTQMVALRGFAGLNYDGSVPGIASPTYTGAILAPTSRTAASIYYAHETSYYAGGGVAVKW